MAYQPHELTPGEVVFGLPPVPAVEGDTGHDASVIGQARALSALSLGLGIKAKGYNVFIMGSPGTGRRTALLRALSHYTSSPGQLQDKAFVCNFAVPSEPRALSFPAGRAAAFKREVHDLVEDVKRLVALHEESDDFKSRRAAVVAELERNENRKIAAFETEAAAAGFRVVQEASGEGQATDLVPIRDGEPVPFEVLQAAVAAGTLPTEEWNALREAYYGLMDRMKALFESLKAERARIDARVAEIRRGMLEPLVDARMAGLPAAFPGERVEAWLRELRDDVVQHFFLFSKPRAEREAARRRRAAPLARYGVNVVADRSDASASPVVFENRPTLANLVGSVDLSGGPADDAWSAYLRIRAGSLVKASGGVLVMRAEDIVQDEEAWQYLKRVLQTGTVEIQGASGPFGPAAPVKPQALEVSVKVVLIGGELSYDLLYQTDPDFQKLFKVCAEFESTMDRTPESEKSYVAFLAKIVADEGLLPLAPDGAGAVLERSVRDAERRGKLSTRFSAIADLLREADWWARKDGKAALDAAAVRRAVEMRAYLHRSPEDKIESMILSGEIIVALEGTAVGKANGLAVHDRGYYAFGLPVVVSARVAPGDGGVVNIEGESGLSGEIFDKAVLILSGYLRSRYARSFPLSITASVCFEQSYTAIDGDSATAIQLCVLLSAISGVPLRQDLAVTGSVNQLGDVQPVGGVSEKVEGFHAICAKRGLTGSQGVVIPRRNVENLVLSDEVEDSVRAGLFHVYAVDRLDQILEILAGKPAGEEDKNGRFPEGSVNALVSRELERMAKVIRRFET